MRVLVVEDDRHVAELIARGLSEIGISCIVAEDVESAERLLPATRVDGLTLDLGMPGRHGLDWLETVARERPDLARRTVVITGLDLGPEVAQRLARCGASVLAKPFTLEGLHRAVRSQNVRPSAAGRGG